MKEGRIMSDQSIREALDKADRLLDGEKPTLVKVQYYSEKTGELSPREYTYFSEEPLAIGDIVIVPVRDTTGKAKVIAIDVLDAEIEAFRDKVKVIPAGAKFVDQRPKYTEEVIVTEVVVEEEKEATDYERMAEESTYLNESDTAVALRPGEDIEAHSHYEEALRLLEYAEKRTIASLEDNKAASDDLTIISRLKRTMEAKKREYLDPLRVQADAIRETYSTLMDPILAAEKLTKDKMLAYDAEQRRIRAAQEEINRKRLEAAQEEMKLSGELSESINLVEVMPEISKRVVTEVGSTRQQDVWKWRVVNFALVEDQYKMINAGMVTPIVKASKGKITIPGIEIYNDPIIATRAR